jgi:hypothetical protein
VCADRKLSSAIIHEISSHCERDQSLAVAYFYFDFNDGRKQLVNNLIRSLITQLSKQCSSVPVGLVTLYSNCLNGQNQPSTTSLTRVLRDILTSSFFRHAYIVLDALDECSEQDDLLSFLGDVTDWELDSLHILATSRQDRTTIEYLECRISGAIDIQSAVIDTDIQIHIQERLRTDLSLKKWPSGVQDEIETSLMESAHGMLAISSSAMPPRD